MTERFVGLEEKYEATFSSNGWYEIREKEEEDNAWVATDNPVDLKR